jgi:hypothetical protein
VTQRLDVIMSRTVGALDNQFRNRPYTSSETNRDETGSIGVVIQLLPPQRITKEKGHTHHRNEFACISKAHGTHRDVEIESTRFVPDRSFGPSLALATFFLGLFTPVKQPLPNAPVPAFSSSPLLL